MPVCQGIPYKNSRRRLTPPHHRQPDDAEGEVRKRGGFGDVLESIYTDL